MPGPPEPQGQASTGPRSADRRSDMVAALRPLLIDVSSGPPRLDGDYVRDESEQVRYLEELTATFAGEGVDLAFWFTFAGYDLVHDADPRRDLDMASFGVV